MPCSISRRLVNTLRCLNNSIRHFHTIHTNMKSICFSFLAVLFTSLSSFAQEDAITKYFNKYMDDEKFSVVYISPKMFSMVSKIEIEDMEPELQEVIKSMKGLRILHTEQNALQYYNDALKTINTSEYELLLTARGEGENVRFMVKDNGDIVEELLMIVGGNENFALLSFIGNIDLKKIGKLAKALDIDNMQYLENLDKKN
jgi:N-glycosylase/DNA lyase